jgi:hypothetical protein
MKRPTSANAGSSEKDVTSDSLKQGVSGTGATGGRRSALRHRTPTLNITQIRARLAEDTDDLERALKTLPENPTSSVASNLEQIEHCAGRITQALRQRTGVMF